jgi:GAF domain-containing protein
MLLAVGLAASVVLFARTGEVRIGLLAGLLAALGVPQALALWQAGWSAPLAVDLATASASAGLLASLLGLLTVLAMGRTLRELERAETLHWESMEGVRGITELASRRSMSVEEKLPLLLEMGCERLDLEIGLVSRARGERYEVMALHAPEDFPVSAGAVFELADAPCAQTLVSERPVARSRSDASPRGALPFESYLGARIRVGEEVFGSLAFASLEARRERFQASHKDLVALMAQWIGTELERADLAGAQRRVPPRSGPAGSSGHGVRSRRPAAAGGVVLNEVVERLEKRIRRAAGPTVEVVFELEPGLEAAGELRIPLEAIVLALVRKAAESVDEGGVVVVSTANHEFSREPGVMPALEPDRYVTLSVRETSGRVDADVLSRDFDVPTHPEARISLPSVYRMLQRVGGDLSVEVEPGRGSTFTLFLPREKRPVRAAGLPPVAAPPPGH